MLPSRGRASQNAMVSQPSAPTERPTDAARDGTAPRRSNLPIPLSSFIGRQRELAQLSALLAQHALVTLTGPGGVGKTRLAIEVARSTEMRFADGAWLVELAPLADAQLVPQFVAAVLGVREQ